MGILYKFTIEFEGDTPTVENLQIFCTKHDDKPPIRFIDFKCPLPPCENSKHALDEIKVLNLLESGIIGYWEDKNNKT